MCRLLAYLGQPILLEDIIIKPVNSLVSQSLHARESTIPTNGDGFGLGWYDQAINTYPGLFTSIFPAWNDRNFLNLSAKIKSSCFFAHIRAASYGSVNNYNCHPFVNQEWMLMHNGQIDDFITIKRHLRRLLDDDLYQWIAGETDSEHLFALFLQLAKNQDLTNLHTCLSILQETFAVIDALLAQYVGRNNSSFNIILTDGARLIATRYSANHHLQPESLHYMTATNFQALNSIEPEKHNKKHQSVLIASEKLTDFANEWSIVPKNHALLVDHDHIIQFIAL